MAETLESDKWAVLRGSGSLEPEMCDWGPAVKEKVHEGGAKAEIDTSAPFESVKEAVSRFGGLGFWKPNIQQRDKDDVKHKNGFSTSEVFQVDDLCFRALDAGSYVKEEVEASSVQGATSITKFTAFSNLAMCDEPTVKALVCRSWDAKNLSGKYLGKVHPKR